MEGTGRGWWELERTVGVGEDGVSQGGWWKMERIVGVLEDGRSWRE